MNTEFKKKLIAVLGLNHEPYTGVRHCSNCLAYNDLLKAHNQHLRTVLEGLKTEYDKKYQKIAEELDPGRETPHTVFHQIINAEIAKLDKPKLDRVVDCLVKDYGDTLKELSSDD